MYGIFEQHYFICTYYRTSSTYFSKLSRHLFASRPLKGYARLPSRYAAPLSRQVGKVVHQNARYMPRHHSTLFGIRDKENDYPAIEHGQRAGSQGKTREITSRNWERARQNIRFADTLNVRKRISAKKASERAGKSSSRLSESRGYYNGGSMPERSRKWAWSWS
jgi:hypothetical protein